MKKVLLSLCTIFMVACNSEELQVNQTKNSFQDLTEVSTVMVYGDKVIRNSRSSSGGELALFFKDFSSVKSFENKLANMSNQEKMQLVKNLGVTTFHELEQIADDELEEIGLKSSTESEFKQLYNQYLNKYSGILIPNNVDTSDLNLYAPDGDNIKSYISNSNRVYVVKNSVIKAELKDKLPKFATQLFSTNSASLPINRSVYSPKSGKKVYFEAYKINERMHVKMYCRKKMWYGWKNDPARSYYFDSFLDNNFVYLSQGQYGQEIPESRLPRYIFNNNVKNGFDIILGKTNGRSFITGQIYTWTDMTSEHDSNDKDITEKIGGIIVPKCLNSKAEIINIKL